MWRWILLVALAYVGLHALLRKRGESWNGLSPSGVFILWRTQRGRPLFERLSRPKHFWAVASDAGILLTTLTGIAVLVFFASRAIASLHGGGILPAAPTGLRGMLGLPGINPLIPLGYGLVALTLAILVHEGAHAVVAYANGMRLKSSGIVLLGLPVGAFVEPEPEQIHRASTRARVRVFAAGPAANLALAAVAAVLLAAVLGAGLDVVNDGRGVGVTEVVDGTPAHERGIPPGAVLVNINQEALLTNQDLRRVLEERAPGDTVEIAWLYEGQARASTLQLAPHPSNPEAAFLGVSAVDLAYLDGMHAILASPLRDGGASFATGTHSTPPGSFLLYLTYPVLSFATGVDALAQPYSDFLEAKGPFEAMGAPAVTAVATLLYWLVWTNVMLATFNALPFGPLDGGQILRATLRAHWFRRAGIPAHATRPPLTDSDDDLAAADARYEPQLRAVRERLQSATWAAAVVTVLLVFAPNLLGWLIIRL